MLGGIRPGLQLFLQFSAEVRAQCRPVMLFHTQLGKASCFGAVFMDGMHFHVETGKGKTKTVAKKNRFQLLRHG